MPLHTGGDLVIAEMYHDPTLDRQPLHVDMHHWWADIDTLVGMCHHHTFTRDHILERSEALDLSHMTVTELESITFDRDDHELGQQLKQGCDQYLARIRDRPEFTRLAAQAEHMLQRLLDEPWRSAPVVLITAQK